MSQIFSTAGLPSRERTAFWTDLVCGTYVDLECEPAASKDIVEGEILAFTFSNLQLSRVTATAQTVRRTPTKIARSNEDFFLVSVQTSGDGLVSQDGREAFLRPGDFALYDSTRPYVLSFSGNMQQYVLRFPGPLLRGSLRDAERLTATPIHGDKGTGYLLQSMIRTLATDIGALTNASAAAVADGVMSLLIAGLSELPAAQARPASSLAALHRQQIRQAVQLHLREPGFGVAALANVLRVSPSTLQRAWSGESCSLHEFIWTCRLEGAKRELVQPAMRSRSVSEIAYFWGFNDAAHFSRTFRARYGLAPRDVRPPSTP
ncbi:helix-turn-helix domain-containing protein [Variovorax sp. Root411]|uniref:AraC-like ligand-binding domain-containing protein n=1 Tax=Variovorax sp. Root411 TaxID=1736530 RepID=UPI0009E676A6|nr:helix-turn-helix domain-containing protein [Variovorax sp. Root411]